MKHFLTFITEARITKASQQAKRLGLVGDGHGDWYDQQGNLKAKTVNGELKMFGTGGASDDEVKDKILKVIEENEKSIVTTVNEIILMIPTDGLIDIEAEKNRLSKELENITNEIEIIDKRLNNPSFIEKAPPKVIEDVKTKKTIFNQRKSEINKALLNL